MGAQRGFKDQWEAPAGVRKPMGSQQGSKGQWEAPAGIRGPKGAQQESREPTGGPLQQASKANGSTGARELRAQQESESQ
jgi:hypothetical protein